MGGGQNLRKLEGGGEIQGKFRPVLQRFSRISSIWWKFKFLGAAFGASSSLLAARSVRSDPPILISETRLMMWSPGTAARLCQVPRRAWEHLR